MFLQLWKSNLSDLVLLFLFSLYLVLVKCFKCFIQFFSVQVLHFNHATPALQYIYFDFSSWFFF